jgi:hypothetical protein
VLLDNHGWSASDSLTDPGVGIDVISGRRGPMAELGVVDAASVVIGAFDTAVLATRQFLTQGNVQPTPEPRQVPDTAKPAPFTEEEQKRRSIDHTLARFSAIHDEIKVEE